MYYVLDENTLSQWKTNKNRKILFSMYLFDYVLYDKRIIITFGGNTITNNNQIKNSDKIYYIDLLNKNSIWKESKIKCKKSGRCNAVLVNDK